MIQETLMQDHIDSQHFGCLLRMISLLTLGKDHFIAERAGDQQSAHLTMPAKPSRFPIQFSVLSLQQKDCRHRRTNVNSGQAKGTKKTSQHVTAAKSNFKSPKC